MERHRQGTLVHLSFHTLQQKPWSSVTLKLKQLTESHRCECDDISHGTMLEKMNTLQGIHISPLIFGIFEWMTFLNNQVGYVLEGK